MHAGYFGVLGGKLDILSWHLRRMTAASEIIWIWIILDYCEQSARLMLRQLLLSDSK